MKKLNLKDLKVKSFVTSFEKEEAQTINGGEKGFLSIGKHCTHAHNGCHGTDHSKGLFCNPH